jgi:catechol 2,3-dioxygenase-like lactoylglutathione lyase family enzyme
MNSRSVSIGMLTLDGIDHVALAVADVERSAAWFIEVLGFERRFEGMWNGVPAFVGKGETAIALFPRRASRDSAHGEPRQQQNIDMLHLAFRADRKNFLAAQADLNSRGVRFDFEDHGVSHSIYFRSPDGHRFEITTYELNQG